MTWHLKGAKLYSFRPHCTRFDQIQTKLISTSRPSLNIKTVSPIPCAHANQMRYSTRNATTRCHTAPPRLLRYAACILAATAAMTCPRRAHAFTPVQPRKSMRIPLAILPWGEMRGQMSHTARAESLHMQVSQLGVASLFGLHSHVMMMIMINSRTVLTGLEQVDRTWSSGQPRKNMGARHGAAASDAGPREDTEADAHAGDAAKTNKSAPPPPSPADPAPRTETETHEKVGHENGHDENTTRSKQQRRRQQQQQQQQQHLHSQRQLETDASTARPHHHSRSNSRNQPDRASRRDFVRRTCTGRYCRKHWLKSGKSKEPATPSSADVLQQDGPLDVEAYARAIQADMARIMQASPS